MTLSDTANSDTRHRMLSAAKSWSNLAPPSSGSGRIGAADWLSSRENPLLRHHRIAVARDVILAVIDRVLSQVQEDDDFDDLQKVKMMKNYDRVDNYVAALKVLAI